MDKIIVEPDAILHGVFFDLDGVLVDACDWHYEALNRALLEVTDYEISREDHESKFNALPTRKKMSMLIEMGVLTEDQAEAVYDRKQELTKQVIEERCGEDEAKLELSRFLTDNGFYKACVTNSIRETAEMMVRRCGMKVDLLVANTDITLPKPHGEPYIRAMIYFKLQPETVIVVEDTDKGAASALAAGIPRRNIWRVENATEVTVENFEAWLSSR